MNPAAVKELQKELQAAVKELQKELQRCRHFNLANIDPTEELNPINPSNLDPVFRGIALPRLIEHGEVRYTEVMAEAGAVLRRLDDTVYSKILGDENNLVFQRRLRQSWEGIIRLNNGQ